MFQSYEFFIRFSTLHGVDHIKVNSPEWKAYLCLRNILCFTEIPIHTENIVDMYRWYYVIFLDCYGQIHLKTHKPSDKYQTPFVYKMHRLSHYPKKIRLLGPLKKTSTLRYERVHQVFKRIASTNKSAQSIVINLASRFVDQTTLHNYIAPNSIQKLHTNSQFMSYTKLPSYMHDLFNHKMSLLELKSAYFDNVTINVGDYFAIVNAEVLKLSTPISPPFPFMVVRVERLFLESFDESGITGSLAFCGTVWTIDAFDVNLFAFRISSSKNYVRFSKNDLFRHDALYFQKYKNDLYILNNFYFINQLLFDHRLQAARPPPPPKKQNKTST